MRFLREKMGTERSVKGKKRDVEGSLAGSGEMYGRNGEILLRKEESDRLLGEGDSGFSTEKRRLG